MGEGAERGENAFQLGGNDFRFVVLRGAANGEMLGMVQIRGSDSSPKLVLLKGVLTNL
jgi:hypothetical protein